MSKIYKAGIIGGGISGVVIALQLAKDNVDTILFEQGSGIVSGPPFCHLHAGGNLYPDISDEQCRKLMKQSIEMARLFPKSIDKRPTFISIPKTENYESKNIERRLGMLVEYYGQLIKEDPLNEVLGTPEEYYKKYNIEDLKKLIESPSVKYPVSADEWMSNTLKLIDYTKLKMPVFLVQEYGWNLFRVGAQAQLALTRAENCNLKLRSKVNYIRDVRNKNLNYNWEICTNNSVYKVKYLVNSCGFRTGKIDELLNFKTQHLLEFKAAYISKWHHIPGLIPELVFHGKRSTSHGMAQLTPYNDDYYQIHGMTKDITLFNNGLIKTQKNDDCLEFNESIMRKINHGWNQEEIKIRTENAINFISKFVPSFKSATLGGPPLFGAQQIPGEDPDLRVGEASFPSKYYARSEIVKASSALTVAREIILRMQEEESLPMILNNCNKNLLLENISKSEIDKMASKIAIKRGYPEAMSHLLIDSGIS